MGGKAKEPEVTQVPTVTPQQSQLLNQLLRFVPGAMEGFTVGQPYGGSAKPGYSQHTIGSGKGGTTPGGGTMSAKGGTPVDDLLTRPFTGPFQQGQTGNFQR